MLPPTAQRTLQHRIYIALARVLDKSESWAERAIPALGPYPAAVVGRRLLQRAVQIFTPALLERASRETPDSPGLAWTGIIECAGIRLDNRTGAVGLSTLLVLRSVASFLLHWSAALAFYIRVFFRAGPGDPRPCALLSGVGMESIFSGKDDAPFVEFCREGPIEPLIRAPRILVQYPFARRSLMDDRIRYAPRILPELHATLPAPDTTETASFLRAHLGALAVYLRTILRCPVLCLLGKDFAYEALAASLNRRSAISAILMTNGDYEYQPLWMSDMPGRCFKTYMLWYSTNVTPFIYRDAPLFGPPPFYRYIRVDESCDWSPEHALELKKLRVRAVSHPVGPIVWRVPRRSPPRKSATETRIGLFDVTPLDPQWAQRNALAFSYYSLEVERAFLYDSLAACRSLEEKTGRPTHLILKPKRGYTPHHDSSYIDLVGGLARQGKIVLAGDEGRDLFGFISGLDLVIVAPFSSPAHIARSLGVPALYYDPTGMIDSASAPGGAALVSSSDELVEAVYRILTVTAANPKELG